jgi:hypothetical protein
LARRPVVLTWWFLPAVCPALEHPLLLRFDGVPVGVVRVDVDVAFYEKCGFRRDAGSSGDPYHVPRHKVLQPDYIQAILTLVDYEVWCTVQMLDCLDGLSEAECRRDFGFGHRTPHRTMFHVAVVMRGWGRAVGPGIETPTWADVPGEPDAFRNPEASDRRGESSPSGGVGVARGRSARRRAAPASGPSSRHARHAPPRAAAQHAHADGFVLGPWADATHATQVETA